MRPLPVALALTMGAAIYALSTRVLPQVVSPPAPPVVRTDPARIHPIPSASEDLPTRAIDMKEARADALRRRIAKEPGDAEARALLMGYGMFHRDAPNARMERDAQIVWFAANLPDSSVLSSGEAYLDEVLDANTYALVRKLLGEARANRPKSVPILLNIANLTQVAESPVAIDALRQAASVEPKNGHIEERLGHAYELASRGLTGIDPATASLALDAFLRARSLGVSVNRSYLVETAFNAHRDDVAAKESNAAIRDAADADEVHQAHTTLGRLALQRGDVAAAKAELLLSAQVEGSPVLGSFGPQMDLAKELLARGERATVLQYLRATGKFWKDERQTRWTQSVANGGTPDWD